MKTLEQQIIEKQDELIEQLMSSHIDWMEVDLIQSELSALKSQLKEQGVSDEDIERWIDKVQPAKGGYKSDYKFAAKAMRDGLIEPSVKNTLSENWNM